MTKTNNTGNTPITYNMRHPSHGMTIAAKIAARAAPTWAPIPAMDEARPICFFEKVSEIKDIQAPYSPPAPIPAINRNK